MDKASPRACKLPLNLQVDTGRWPVEVTQDDVLASNMTAEQEAYVLSQPNAGRIHVGGGFLEHRLQMLGLGGTERHFDTQSMAMANAPGCNQVLDYTTPATYGHSLSQPRGSNSMVARKAQRAYRHGARALHPTGGSITAQNFAAGVPASFLERTAAVGTYCRQSPFAAKQSPQTELVCMTRDSGYLHIERVRPATVTNKTDKNKFRSYQQLVKVNPPHRC